MSLEVLKELSRVLRGPEGFKGIPKESKKGSKGFNTKRVFREYNEALIFGHSTLYIERDCKKGQMGEKVASSLRMRKKKCLSKKEQKTQHTR